MIDPRRIAGIKRALAEILGDERVLSEKTDLTPYVKDSCNIRLREDYRFFPDLVVRPETTEEVQKIVEVAAEHKIPLIPKGGGSNRTGMLIPVHGGIVVDMIRMNRIVGLDIPNLSVTVQPGITLKELDDFLASSGCSLHQEQGSIKVATIGGSISTYGFSRKHQKYGTIANRVMSLEVVLANGKILRTGPKVLYTSTGYRLNQLFIGAEGTLGIITEATLRIEPLAEAKDAIIAFYDDFWKVKEAAQKLTASNVIFAGAEIQESDGAEELGAPPGKKGIFLVIFEGTRDEVDAELSFVRNLIEETGGIIGEREQAIKHVGDYSLLWCGSRAELNGFVDELNPYIPMDKMKEFYDRLWNEIMPKYGIEPLLGEKYDADVGRFGMAYSQFCIPGDQDGQEKYKIAKREIAELITELGGSISSCVGVGIIHRDDLDLEFSDVALDIMWSIKREFDLHNIMNPGKMLP